MIHLSPIRIWGFLLGRTLTVTGVLGSRCGKDSSAETKQQWWLLKTDENV